METPIDPIRIPVLSLTEDEVSEARAGIEKGMLPRNWFDLVDQATARNVFGADAVKDRNGNYVEQGLGSEFGMSRNSINAYKKFCKDEPDFEKNVARMEKQLVAANERRKAAARR